MNKNYLLLLTCLLLVASTTYIICNKREQVPPMLVWEGKNIMLRMNLPKQKKSGKGSRSNKEN